MLFIVINIILLSRFPQNHVLFFTQVTERVGVTVTVRTPLREILGSNLGLDASHPDRLLWFSSAPTPCKCDSISNCTTLSCFQALSL